MRSAPVIALLTGTVALAANAGAAFATDIFVNTTTDGSVSGKCSLRDAIYAAHHDVTRNACPAGTGPDDTIVLASGATYNISQASTGNATPGLAGGPLTIGTSVRIESRGSRANIDLTNCKDCSGGALRIKDYNFAYPIVEFNNVTVRNAPGIGVFIEWTAELRFSNGTISGHKDSGIWNEGGFFLSNSTVENNRTTTTGNKSAGLTNAGSAFLSSVKIRYNGMNSSGADTGPANFGGGIFNTSTGSLDVSSSAIYGNAGHRGGGIANNGSMSMNGSTVSGNRGQIYGAGIMSTNWASLNGVTVAFNTIRCRSGSTCQGGGAYASGSFYIRNVVIAKNRKENPLGSFRDGDCVGTITSGNGNLIGTRQNDNCTVSASHPPGEPNHDIIGGTSSSIDPGLNSTLGTVWGGLTPYHAPNSGGRVATSSGIGCEEYWDQKLALRPSGSKCEMGAVEMP
jgi:hypothetical protein